MGDENKRNNPTKPTVSKTVVKKKTQGDAEKTISSNSQKSTERSTNEKTRRTAGASATGQGRRTTGASATGQGRRTTGASATGQGRRTAGASATGQGRRTTGASATGQGRRTTEQNTSGRTPESRVRKKRRRRRITIGQLTVFLAIVIGVILFLIINAVMRNKYLKVSTITVEYTLGTKFDITNYVEAENENAVLEFDDSDFSPEEVGSYEIEYTVRVGKLKKTNSLTLDVVDKTFPKIVGPEVLGVILNEEVNLLDYYTVEDEEPNLEESLMIDKAVDTSETGTTTYNLYVTDWSNNSTSLEISIKVYDLTGSKEMAARAVREFNKLNGYKASGSSVYVYYPDSDSEHCYVLINNTDIYEIDEDKNCSLLDEDEELIQTILANAESVNIDSLDKFNYYSE